MARPYEMYRAKIESRTSTALRCSAIGGDGLQDAAVILWELNYMSFHDCHDTIKRDRLYAMRDEAVRKVSQAIEDAE